jgi:hypothetical protein
MESGIAANSMQEKYGVGYGFVVLTISFPFFPFFFPVLLLVLVLVLVLIQFHDGLGGDVLSCLHVHK